MSTSRKGMRQTTSPQAHSGPDSSKRWPCPQYDADPKSSLIQEKCTVWSGANIAEVTRHLRTHHADCHKWIDILSSSRLQPDARYAKYRSFFSILEPYEAIEDEDTMNGSVDTGSQETVIERPGSSTQEREYSTRDHPEKTVLDRPVHYSLQPGLQFRQGERLTQQQNSRDSMFNHSRLNSPNHSASASSWNIDNPYPQDRHIDDYASVPLNNPSFTAGLDPNANAPSNSGFNESMTVSMSQTDHQAQSWPNQVKGLPYPDAGHNFDTKQPSVIYPGSSSLYTTGAFGQLPAGDFGSTANTLTAHSMRQNMVMRTSHSLTHQPQGQTPSRTPINHSPQTRDDSDDCCCQCHLPEHEDVLCFVCEVKHKKAQCNCEGRRSCCSCRASTLPIAPQIQRSFSYGSDQGNVYQTRRS